MSLRRALLLLVALVLTAGLLPAGILLESRLGEALLQRSREDLSRAPMVLKDRLTAVRTVRMMHARDLATMPGLASAIAGDDLEAARRMVQDGARSVQEEPVLVGPGGQPLASPGGVPEELIEATRRGEMPVAVVPAGEGLHLMALAPVTDSERWLGAAGGSTPFGDAEAGTLSGLTRSDVVLLDEDGRVMGSTIEGDRAVALAAAWGGAPKDAIDPSILDLMVDDRAVLAAWTPLDHGTALFTRDLESELAVLPALRRTALTAALLALVFAVGVGVFFAGRLSRPVSELADAAQGFASGQADAPLRPSSITEVRRMSDAFASMRASLASRLHDLEDRQERLSALQAELVQRERMAASARLLAQLAHEIRNPVASVRNCLEVVRRKGNLEGEAREFADMAVDELLRMHELAERMLDLHRARNSDEGGCDAAEVARETAQLARAGEPPGAGAISVVGSSEARVAISADALKQVLLNLVLNAREASPEAGPVEIVVSERSRSVLIEVLDRGPGLTAEVRPRLFDPFFTTKTEVQGVGLGLYTAEGLVRSAGGTVIAANRGDGPGARFTVELPVLEEA